MDWSDIQGKRLALILIASNSDERGGIVRGRVQRLEDGFAVERPTGPAFPLLPEWADLLRSLNDVEDADVGAIIGDVDHFLSLSVGDVDDLSEGEKQGLQSTGLNWNEFIGNDSE